MAESFPRIGFNGQLRPSQPDVAEIARRKLARDQRRLYVVAPPGAAQREGPMKEWMNG